MRPPKAPVYRYSELGLTPEGERRLFFRTYNADPAKINLDTLLAEGDVIQPAEVSSWFGPLGLALSAHEADELAYVVNLMRVTQPKEAGFPDQLRLEAVAKTLPVIMDNVPILIDIQQQALSKVQLDAPVPEIVRRDIARRRNMLSNLTMLHAAAQLLRNDPIFATSGRKKRDALWQRDMIWLWFLFDGLARKHGAEISFTKEEGLGTKLIQTALGRAGIAVSLPATAKAIGRFKDKPLRVIDLPPGRWGDKPKNSCPTTGRFATANPTSSIADEDSACLTIRSTAGAGSTGCAGRPITT